MEPQSNQGIRDADARESYISQLLWADVPSPSVVQLLFAEFSAPFMSIVLGILAAVIGNWWLDLDTQLQVLVFCAVALVSAISSHGVIAHPTQMLTVNALKALVLAVYRRQ